VPCRQHRGLALLQCRDSVCGFGIGLYVHENQLIGQTPMAGPVLFSRVTQITAPKSWAGQGGGDLVIMQPVQC
jgi:hypothetical protein